MSGSTLKVLNEDEEIKVDDFKEFLNECLKSSNATVIIINNPKEADNNKSKSSFKNVFLNKELDGVLSDEDIPLNKRIHKRVSEILCLIGIPLQNRGYEFLCESICQVVTNPEKAERVTQFLYPSVAKIFCENAARVERNIRHALKVSMDSGKMENINAVFGFNVFRRQDWFTNSEFIALVANRIKYEFNL